MEKKHINGSPLTVDSYITNQALHLNPICEVIIAEVGKSEQQLYYPSGLKVPKKRNWRKKLLNITTESSKVEKLEEKTATSEDVKELVKNLIE